MGFYKGQVTHPVSAGIAIHKNKINDLSGVHKF